MATFSDNFNRADDPIGSNWTTVAGSGTPNVESNALRAAGVFSAATVATAAATFANDQSAQVRYAALAEADYAGLLIRFNPATVSGYIVAADGINSAARTLSRLSAGVPTGLSSTPIVPSVNSIVRLEAQGTSIRVYVDDALIINVTDATFESGQPGIVFNAQADNQTYLDDFYAEDLEVGPITLEADPRALVLATSDATLRYVKARTVLTADTAETLLTPVDATFQHNEPALVLSAEEANINLTGAFALPFLRYIFDTNVEELLLTPTDALLKRKRTLTADAAYIALTATANKILYHRHFAPATAAQFLTPKDISFSTEKRLLAALGELFLTPVDAALHHQYETSIYLHTERGVIHLTPIEARIGRESITVEANGETINLMPIDATFDRFLGIRAHGNAIILRPIKARLSWSEEQLGFLSQPHPTQIAIAIKL